VSLEIYASFQLLDLSGNRLRRVNGDELHKTHRLTHLSLNNNQITAIDDRVIAALPSLQFINLHGNQLKVSSQGQNACTMKHA
jgi:Leucine-rich repeat (LRR) protein